MMDCISRQAAIDALEQGFKDTTNGIDKLSPTYGLTKAMTGIYKCYIEKLPHIQPRRGKWIDGIIPNDSGGLPVIVCDQCNTFFPLQFGDGHNFCPNCGAKMEE